MTKETLDLLIRLWPIYFASIGFTVWIVRLEVKVTFQDQIIKDLKDDLKEIKDKL